MPTQSTTYNSRVTDESLEKRFRDTFRAQGGAELVDDLYAQGVIVPVVDFTAAATGDVLAENLQTAWDFSTGNDQTINATDTIITNAGFWQIDVYATFDGVASGDFQMAITDGLTSKRIWYGFAPAGNENVVFENKFVVFLRSGDSLTQTSGSSSVIIRSWFRQIATLNGDLVNPTGFTSS